MEVGKFLIEIIRIVVISYFLERGIRLIEKRLKLKSINQKKEIYDKEFWG